MFSRSAQSFLFSTAGLTLLGMVAHVLAADRAPRPDSEPQARSVRADGSAAIEPRKEEPRRTASDDAAFTGRARVSRSSSGLWTLALGDDGAEFQFYATSVSGDLRDEAPVDGATSLRFIASDLLSIQLDASFANNIIFYDVLLQLEARDARRLSRNLQVVSESVDEGGDEPNAADGSSPSTVDPLDDSDATEDDDSEVAGGPVCNSCKCPGKCQISCPDDLVPKCECGAQVCRCVAWPRPY